MESNFTFDCPSLQECTWKGKKEDLIEHYAECHKKLYGQNSKLNLFAPTTVNHDKNILVNFSSHVFLLQFKSDIGSGMFWCGVRYIGKTTNASQFLYEISFFNANNETICKIGLIQLQLSASWDFDEDLMMQFDLNSVKTKENIFEIHFKLLREKRANINIYKLLINELKCLICRVPVHPPVFLCLTGHLVCNNCKTESRRCRYTKNKQQCKLKLEDATKLVRYPCKNETNGCDYIGDQEQIKDHGNNCSIIDCLVIKDKIKCEWKGRNENFFFHLLQKHPESLSICKKIMSYDLNTNPFTFITFIRYADDNIFKVSCQTDYSKLMTTWSCHSVCLKTNSCEEYKLRIKFLNPDNPKKGRYYTVDCCPLVQQTEVKTENISVDIPFHSIKHFIADNKLMIMYFLLDD